MMTSCTLVSTFKLCGCHLTQWRNIESVHMARSAYEIQTNYWQDLTGQIVKTKEECFAVGGMVVHTVPATLTKFRLSIYDFKLSLIFMKENGMIRKLT
jgi:hypothetical protein